mmetsp:Transcript_26413/g.56627  ORF Transcript_26413/g.56627 Transcript_26413/m.56627 type:complete len:82 (-) Transcript_26413:752-997(-)
MHLRLMEEKKSTQMRLIPLERSVLIKFRQYPPSRKKSCCLFLEEVIQDVLVKVGIVVKNEVVFKTVLRFVVGTVSFIRTRF